MAKFGLDHATLARDKPALVYCSVSAFGQSGPRAKEGGFDMTLQAMSGVMSVTGEADGRPVKCGIPIADFTAGLYAAFSVVSALHKANARRGRRSHRRLDAGRHAWHRQSADQRIFRHRPRPGQAGLRAPDERALRRVPLPRRLFRAGGRHRQAVAGGLRRHRAARSDAGCAFRLAQPARPASE